jgi:DNA-binding protein HU-beta
MKKADIIGTVSELAKTNGEDISKKKIELVYDAIINEFARILQSGEDVALNGIGILKVRERAAREARNPRTGEALHIPAQKAVVFKQSTVIKNALNCAGKGEKKADKKPAKKSAKK